MRANCTVFLCDVSSVQDVGTGERLKDVTNVRKLNGEKTNVGMSTFWSAASANVQLDCTVNIRSKMYQNQKYAVLENELFEVVNSGKAEDISVIRLNLKQINDNELKGLITDAVGLLQTP